MSCAPSGDGGPTSYIEIEKTRNKLSETKGNNKKTNEQTNKNKKNITKTNNNPRA
jgi:peptidoglycan hydrolase CwlO-like protein